jgi:hypothetical protein
VSKSASAEAMLIIKLRRMGYIILAGNYIYQAWQQSSKIQPQEEKAEDK